MPPRVDYELTKMGHTLLDAVGALMDWADTHLREIDAARAAYDARAVNPVPPAAPDADSNGSRRPVNSQSSDLRSARSRLGDGHTRPHSLPGRVPLTRSAAGMLARSSTLGAAQPAMARGCSGSG
jgi:HxlR-like helix-turn-helix